MRALLPPNDSAIWTTLDLAMLTAGFRFKLYGTDEYPKTFLTKGMQPYGEEIE